jgi:hypothetical protein
VARASARPARKPGHGRAMSVPFTRGLGGRQGARAVNSERADLGDLPSVLVGLALGVALQAGGQGFESPQLHHLPALVRAFVSMRLRVLGALGWRGSA